ncbi:MAG: Crp/Fnr family transcriptional regulator [Flavobacteriaceae bacterium]|nr:Crp/Fnr family transcriptional regulator [Flavobacteriaceae bacterium]
MSKCQQCIIKELSALKTLNNEELSRISDCKTTLDFKKGDVIFEEGKHINGVYCIRQGICKISKTGINGKDQIINFISKGNLLGQRSVICDESTNLKATTMTDMSVCFIPKKEILNNLMHNSEFSLSVLKDMSNALKETDNHIVDLAQKPVKQRLAEALLYIHDSFGVDKDGMLSIILSREDYANIVGTATESAIRILSQFKKEGLISTVGKQIKIEDKKGLARQ